MSLRSGRAHDTSTSPNLTPFSLEDVAGDHAVAQAKSVGPIAWIYTLEGPRTVVRGTEEAQGDFHAAVLVSLYLLPCGTRELVWIRSRARICCIRRYRRARGSSFTWATAGSTSRYPFLGRERVPLFATTSTLQGMSSTCGNTYYPAESSSAIINPQAFRLAEGCACAHARIVD